MRAPEQATGFTREMVEVLRQDASNCRGPLMDVLTGADDEGAALYDAIADRIEAFSRDMVEAIYTLLWFGGLTMCQRCLNEGSGEGKMEGGTGRVGDPDCVVTCSECGWFPREDGWVREHASQAAQAMDALLPREGVER